MKLEEETPVFEHAGERASVEEVGTVELPPSYCPFEGAREQDRRWRDQRRRLLEKRIEQGRWLHQRLINPSITLASIVLMVSWVRFAHSPGGFGVDLTSDWALAQWCTRYIFCLAVIFFPPVFVRRRVARQFSRWEHRLRQEQGRVEGAEEGDYTGST